MEKIGIVSGSWDFCHPGHLELFKEAKQHCDYLIVALQVNPKLERKEKNVPIETVSERYLRLKSNVLIDEIIPYETEQEYIELILILRPSIRFLGEDWKDKEFDGKDIDMEFYYVERKHHQSSSGLRRRIGGK